MPRHNQPTRSSTGRGSAPRPKNHRPAPSGRPRAGQHFLIDPLIGFDIVAAAAPQPGEAVLEIGPGGGALTELLLDEGCNVTAVELDETFAAGLRRRFTGRPNLTVIAANILDHAPDELLAEAGRRPPYKVVANFPYYITAPIFRQLLERGPRPSLMVVMIQREVAEAIAGKSGFSLLGVSVQVFGAVEILFAVPPRAFDPPPRVDSAVIRVSVYGKPLVPQDALAGFFQVVRSGFRGPRKQLHNALGSGLWLPPSGAAPILEAAGIAPDRRAATLSIAEWFSLYRAYEAARPGFAGILSTRSDSSDRPESAG